MSEDGVLKLEVYVEICTMYQVIDKPETLDKLSKACPV